jgi:hypothetical protein
VPHSPDVGLVDFPTLGDLVDGWIEQHCRVPALLDRGKPFRQYDRQFWWTANHYRVREQATLGEPEVGWPKGRLILNQAFEARRTQIIDPQKTGKGPWGACITANEACGPSQFFGWAKRGQYYICAENGCPCGWDYRYNVGEPMGTRHPAPLIQLLANSQDQVDNVWGALTAMIYLGPLKELLRSRENFIRIVNPAGNGDPDFDRIDAVTSSATSRVGNPITFALQDESGLYTTSNKMRKVSDDQKRGLAGMGGRAIETTNCYDPSEKSVAQTTFESLAPDVWKYYRRPPTELSFNNLTGRRALLRFNYHGITHITVDSILGECNELMERDPAQAERFFGNRMVAGKGSWLTEGVWERAWAGAIAHDLAS